MTDEFFIFSENQSMFLVTHAAFGAIIGERTGNPFLAAALGFAFHFISDMIPHGDSNVYTDFKKGNAVKQAVAYVTVDAVAAIMFVVLLFNFRDFQHSSSVSAGIAGSVMPDLLVGMCELKALRSRWLAKFHGIHFYFHNMITSRKRDLSFRAGFFMQLVLLALLQIRVF